ncbi:olfactory receptor 1019-like [Alligator mississippiensis]|uniref:Olfactory receptor n=2 Tax=Alligator mississippiensis TaxID=8496 RepID=A0A151MUA5_ALLMI|nr:olfactory receptor 1019-like [Alligator mississippiensis]
MEGKNDSEATEFIFLGFTDRQELQVVLFIIFLAVYIITLVTNIGMILLIQIDSRLHSPMELDPDSTLWSVCWGDAMEKRNCSTVTEFILLGLTDRPELQVILFVFFLVIYFITVVWNLGVLLLVWIDPRLQTPMYFFLGNLSFVDFFYSSVIAPKMLVNFLAKTRTISYNACAMQLYLFGATADVECVLLAVMAYDRYVAICNPLLYPVIMSRKLCNKLVSGAYLVGLVDSMIHTCCTFQLTFCDSNVINHFFCDLPPLLALSCSDTHINEIVLLTFLGAIEMITVLISILISYLSIFITILKVHSTGGRRKALSTCTSHLTAVAIFHGIILFMYFQPASIYSMDTDKMASVFYTLVIPILNPLIYSLRNQDVKDALKNTFRRIVDFK